MIQMTTTIQVRGRFFEVLFDYYPGTASQTSGPVEACHEGDPEEIEILSVKLIDEETALSDDEAEEATDALLAFARTEHERINEDDRIEQMASYYDPYEAF